MMALLQRLTNITEQLAVNQQNQQQLAQAQAQAKAQQQSGTSTKRTKLPDPERFNGKPSEYKSWEATIKAKSLDEGWIGEKAVIYAFERLEKPQQNQVLYLIENGCSDVMELFDHFQRITRNPREHQDAALKLGKIQQKADEYLSSYISRFEKLEREVAGPYHPDTTTSSLRIILFHRGLRQRLRESLEEFESELFKLSYADYVTKVQQHDRGHAKEARAATSNQQPYIKREVAAINASVPSSRRSSSASRRANGSCFYCGSNEHWIANCTKKHRADAANQISQSRFSNQSPVAPIAAATAVPTSSATPTASVQTRSRSASPTAPPALPPTMILQRPRLASTSSSVSSSSICSGLSRFSEDEYCTHNVNIKYETCNICMDYDEGFD
jgi:hypothetical protein